MTYTKQVWSDGKAGATPVNATRLNYMEQGIANADPDTGAVYCVFTSVGAAVNSAVPAATFWGVGTPTISKQFGGIFIPGGDGIKVPVDGTYQCSFRIETPSGVNFNAGRNFISVQHSVDTTQNYRFGVANGGETMGAASASVSCAAGDQIQFKYYLQMSATSVLIYAGAITRIGPKAV